MDKGFRAMVKESGTIPTKFSAAFQVRFSSTTYYIHSAVWSGMDKNALEYAVECGRNPGGEWGPLVSVHGGREKSKDMVTKGRRA